MNHSHPPHCHEHAHDHSHNHTHTHSFEKKTRWVLLLTIITMVIEICAGYILNSMALQSEGWHMATHVFAIGITWLAYFYIKKQTSKGLIAFNQKKLLAVAGYTNAVVLQIIALFVLFESISRLLNPLPIAFDEAIIIAIIGVIVNGLSVALLHHDHDHSDLNMKAAYFHLFADIFTSLTALVALVVGKFYNIQWLDAVSGILGCIVISNWAFTLIKGAGKELIDMK